MTGGKIELQIVLIVGAALFAGIATAENPLIRAFSTTLATCLALSALATVIYDATNHAAERVIKAIKEG